MTDTFSRFLNEVIAIAELGGARRTNLGTSRLLAGLHAIRAHNALADPGIPRVPLVLWLVERAGHHAIPATNTLPDVVYDWAFLCLMEGSNWASRCASWMLAMHAEPPHEFVVPGHDDGVLMFRLHRLGCYFVVVGQLILLRARTLALFATDAHRCVVQ